MRTQNELMDSSCSVPASPGTPLFQVSPERVNQQRFDHNASPSASIKSSSGHVRDSLVLDKVARFDSLAFQGKTLERKANDAALKRAMVGREEAETEMRRYRDEVRTLRKQVDEGTARERKVGERLESVMENYGRAKETHAHTQTLWEKEIRRARKESFKSQSVVVKLQEELKAARNNLRTAQVEYDQERARSKSREQEAFDARYQLVGVQEELANMAEKLKLVEQERDALRTIAKTEEVARIAAEGRIPLPESKDDEFASPSRVSHQLRQVSITSSAAGEEEMEQLRMELEWQRRNAARAYAQAEFMQMECQFRSCSCRLSEKEGHGFVYLSAPLSTPAAECHGEEHLTNISNGEDDDDTLYALPPRAQPSQKENKAPSTIFIPSEGVFRIVAPDPVQSSPWISPEKKHSTHASRPAQEQRHNFILPLQQEFKHSRTPSCEPPSMAQISGSNTSLLSLINGDQASQCSDEDTVIKYSPTLSSRSDTSEKLQMVSSKSASPQKMQVEEKHRVQQSRPISYPTAPQQKQFHTISTTTRVPMHFPSDEPESSFTKLSTPPLLQPSSSNSNLNDSALSPTMTREEALAQIRERRGRARSLAQGLATPRKQMVEGVVRRDISAPANGTMSVGRNGARSASRGRGLLKA